MFIGLVGAVVSAVFVMQSISQVRSASQPPPTPTPEASFAVVYAYTDIPAQTSVRSVLDAQIPTQAENAGSATVNAGVCPTNIAGFSQPIGGVQVCLLPESFTPPSAVKLQGLSPEQLGNLEELRTLINQQIGYKFTQRNIQQGDIIYTSAIEPILVPAGKVETPLAVNSLTSVGGRVRPGHHVDIVVSYRADGAAGTEALTEYLFQNVEVLAVNTNSQRFERVDAIQDPSSDAAYAVLEDLTGGSNSSNTTVVLALSPADALTLINRANFAEQVQLLIRHPDDNEIRDVSAEQLSGSN